MAFKLFYLFHNLLIAWSYSFFSIRKEFRALFIFQTDPDILLPICSFLLKSRNYTYVCRMHCTIPHRYDFYAYTQTFPSVHLHPYCGIRFRARYVSARIVPASAAVPAAQSASQIPAWLPEIHIREAAKVSSVLRNFP